MCVVSGIPISIIHINCAAEILEAIMLPILLEMSIFAFIFAYVDSL